MPGCLEGCLFFIPVCVSAILTVCAYLYMLGTSQSASFLSGYSPFIQFACLSVCFHAQPCRSLLLLLHIILSVRLPAYPSPCHPVLQLPIHLPPSKLSSSGCLHVSQCFIPICLPGFLSLHLLLYSSLKLPTGPLFFLPYQPCCSYHIFN